MARQDHTFNINSESYLRTNQWYVDNGVSEAWALRAENDHVTDFTNWATAQVSPGRRH
jgi:hypothetical protein